MRQCKLGELCWLATVSRPDICARSARIASRANTLQGGDVYRINDLVKTAKKWQPAAVLKYVSSAQLGQEILAPRDENVSRRKERIRGNAMTLVGRLDAAYEGPIQSGEMPTGICHRFNAPQPLLASPHYPLDVKVHTKAGQEQSGW